MKRLLIILLLLFARPAFAVDAIAPGQRFVSIALHDVVDTPAELEAESLTTDHLVALFDFLKGDGWTVISLDDVAAANQKIKPLPEKSILITFDDGYRSLYTRVYPLIQAYHYPVVAALVGQWMDGPMDGNVSYGGEMVPRSKFLSWDEVREMQASKLVEFASHSHSLHADTAANPHGSRMPRAITHRFNDSLGAYDTEAEYESEMIENFKLDRALFVKELKKPARAIVWPFGRYSQKTIDVAKSAGFKFALTLDPEPSNAADLMRLSRFFPTGNPTLAAMIDAMRFQDGFPNVQRLVCLDPSQIYASDSNEFDRRLGLAVERMRSLGVTAVVIKTTAPNEAGELTSWFPTQATGVQADALSRISWQLQTRAGVKTYAWIPLGEMIDTKMASTKINEWFVDLGRMVPLSGLLIDELDLPGTAETLTKTPDLKGPWEVRKNRDLIDLTTLKTYEKLGLSGFEATHFYRPTLSLLTTTKKDISPSLLSNAVDLTLIAGTSEVEPVTQKIRQLDQLGLLNKESQRRRTGLWLTDGHELPQAKNLVADTLTLQMHQGTAIGWCPDLVLEDLPASKEIQATVSAASFPFKP